MVFNHIFAENAPILVKNWIFLFFINPHFWLFFGVLEVKLKFQDKFYDILYHKKCPSSETEGEKCILWKSYFHQIQPNNNCCISLFSSKREEKSEEVTSRTFVCKADLRPNDMCQWQCWKWWWQDDRSDRVTEWSSDQVTKWPSNRVTNWPSDCMTKWLSDRVTE